MARSGYTHCACRDCFDTTVSDDMDDPELCSLCHEAGCDREQDDDGECCRDDAYTDAWDRTSGTKHPR